MSLEFDRVFSYGDGVTVRYGHVGEKDEPCVMIAREAWGKTGIYIVALNQAFRYTDDIYLTRAAFKCAETLNLGREWQTVKRLADIMLDHLDSLVHLPPKARMTPEQRLAHEIEHQGLKLTVDGEQVLGE